MNLSPKHEQLVKAAIANRGISAVARLLGVNRVSLANVLLGCGRPSTTAFVTSACVTKAAELGAS